VGCARTATGAVRWTNHREYRPWLAAVEGGALPSASEEVLRPAELRNERVMLALRTAEGLDASLLSPAQQREVAGLVRGGLAVLRGDRLALTPSGMELHSAVAERLFEPSGG
jgi:oxygen-independent coproporphyrinogen-3 oxidase